MGATLRSLTPMVLASGVSSEAVRSSYGKPCFEDHFHSAAGEIRQYYYCHAKRKLPSDILFFKDDRLLGLAEITIDNFDFNDSTLTASNLHWYYETHERDGIFKKVLASSKSKDLALPNALAKAMPRNAAVGHQLENAARPSAVARATCPNGRMPDDHADMRELPFSKLRALGEKFPDVHNYHFYVKIDRFGKTSDLRISTQPQDDRAEAAIRAFYSSMHFLPDLHGCEAVDGGYLDEDDRFP
jgi:hypothetical protein